ncbi:MAG: hypothetical protein HYT15_00335 [Candidatus Magasanikbacteria bacterium]|nr:hypothetical protein [Candidatus Magasanikbacteria bacterium]
MRLQTFLKLISGLTAGVIMAVALLIFICPGVFMSDTMVSSPDMATPCQSDVGMAVGAVDSSGCTSVHLAQAQRFIGSLGGEMSLLLGALLTVTVIYFISRAEFLNRTRAAFVRYKYYYRLYFASIRLQCQKKTMAWLALLKNYETASLA